ncbi:MAG TPA: hypothetical protein VK928_05100 [Longimicrobiales bacterium]|nr:hypothetical protein [Longimicrobiales bacterium]
MRTRRVTGLFVAAVIALAATACATSQNVATGAQLSIQFQVDNNLPNIAGTSVYLITETGSRRSLGPVESNRRVTFDRSVRAGTYYLSATRIGSTDLTSERFRLDTDGTIVIWSMNQNQISFGQR